MGFIWLLLLFYHCTCNLDESGLRCSYKGDGIYIPDRRLEKIDTLLYEYFGAGQIFVTNHLLPDLREVRLGSGRCEAVKTDDRGRDVMVFVNDRQCVEVRNTIFTPTSVSTGNVLSYCYS